MNSRYNRLFNNPIYFRWGFIILMLLGIILNGFILKNETNFYVLYIFCTIFLGIGFYNLPIWSIFSLTIIVVSCRFFLIPETSYNIETFLAYLFTYLLIAFISVNLMKYTQKVRADNLELTKALANALDSRDTYTMHHSENVARYAVEIAKEMNLSKDLSHAIRIGGLLHDIGKIGIPENILSKPDKLTNDEYNTIKLHPTIGYEMIKHITTFKDNGILDIVLYHHERYDGKGYPKGLKGDQIPLVARIVAVADTFDAMSSKRIYRNELDLEYVLNEIRRNKGSQFDPKIVDIFLSLFESDGQLTSEKYKKFMIDLNMNNAWE